MLLLVPSDVLRPRRVDDHFAAEADAARAAGHQVALVDHDALARGAADRAVKRVPAGEVAIYRGVDAGQRPLHGLRCGAGRPRQPAADRC